MSPRGGDQWSVQGFLDVVVGILRHLAHLLAALVPHVAGFMLHAVDIVRRGFGGRCHHILGHAAEGPGKAQILAGIILQKIAQPFLLHADQAGKALAALQLVHCRAVALQAQVGEAQAFLLGELGHFLNQDALIFARLGQGFTELRDGLGGAGLGGIGLGLGGVHGGNSLGLCAAIKSGKQPAGASFAAGQKLFVTRRWCLADSFAIPLGHPGGPGSLRKSGPFPPNCPIPVRRLPKRAISFAAGGGRRYNPGPQGGFLLSLPPRVSKGVCMGTQVSADYRPSENEPFMNERQREYFRRKLNLWKDEILKESRETIQNLQAETVPHADLADRASTEAERQLELRTRDRQRKLIAKIDAALRRIEDGSYGFCEETGEPISLKRLDARPIATLSIEAQERHERREKVYRDD